ncbi:MAG: hypothetical protein ACRC0Q_04405 [Kurthia gibsonii]
MMNVDYVGKYALPLSGLVFIPGIGWLTLASIAAVVGSIWLITTKGIPWAKKKYSSWYFTQKHISGWDVRVEQHGGKVHAHWKKEVKKVLL